MTRRLIDRVVRRVALPGDPEAHARTLLDTEWLVTNGLGGYASSTLAGVVTRRYHGILVAALPSPLGRTVMLNHLGEQVIVNGVCTPLNGEERVAGRVNLDVMNRIAEVRLEAGLPIWEFRIGDVRIERRVVMPHRQNTVYLTYRLLGGAEQVKLELEPALHFRGYEEPVNAGSNAPASAQYHVSEADGLHVICADGDLPSLRLEVVGGDDRAFIDAPAVHSELIYPVEQDRGYESQGGLWSPGRFAMTLERDGCVTFVASVEEPEVMRALSPEDAMRSELERRRRLLDSAVPHVQDDVGAELVLAADQFIITPRGRVVDATRAAAMGNEVRTVIAGYHWFTDWGRDTMISLEGLTLITGRHAEASFILRTFAHYVRDGLIPNMFPDGSNEGLYHTADATLWFFHALEAYVRRTGDQSTLAQLLPVMIDIVDHHVAGTRFGIGMDPRDGLLCQGAEGYQLTWMDAKVDGWVVTPRRGKAVEINALWYNALRLLEGWLTELRGADAAAGARERAERAYESFNKRFWMEAAGYLFDVVDGPDGDSPLCRPNQLFSISLDHPVLDRARWEPVMKTVRDRLLVPVGLRSLAPGEPDYKPKYWGDLRARDAAYHQGTAWGWLIGPWVDAWLKLHPGDLAGARQFLTGSIAALDDFGLGSIGEIFDAEQPYTPRGCIAQAWSVAEVLRCWAKTAPAVAPSSGATTA